MITRGIKLTTRRNNRRGLLVLASLYCSSGANLAWAQVQPPGATPAPFPSPKPVPTRRPVQPLARGPLTPGVVVKQSKAPTPARAMVTQPAKPLQVTLEGIVTKTARNGEFFLSANDSVYRVRPWSMNFASKVEGGDRIRVFGRSQGLMITLANIRVLEKRASSSPDAY